jgi:hypothetical protein
MNQGRHAVNRAALVTVGALLLSAAAAAAQPGSAALLPVPQISALQGFSVVLVVGDMQGGPADDVPAAARRALTDMKDFLPYKSYRLLDTGWMMGSLPVRSATTRMRGPNNRDLDVLLLANAVSATAINVKFSLQEAGGGADGATPDVTAAELRELRGMRDSVQREIAAREKEGPRTSEPLLAARIRLDELERQIDAVANRGSRGPASATRVIDTSFTMDLGETVVVGTSRMQGNTALIALLTAVPRNAK